MKNFVIPPVSNLDLYKMGSAGFFALGQLCRKYPHYKQYVKDLIAQGVYVILDSGIGDHNPITQQELFDLTCELRPAEVIPLDTLFNAEQTIINMSEFTDMVRQESLDIKILGCPQGKNVREWLMCYDYFLHNEHVNTIGMSKLSIPNALGFATDDSSIKTARQLMVHLLNGSGRLLKPLHFLGLGDPTEMALYSNLIKQNKVSEYVFRSTDSCNIIWSSMNDQDWTKGQTQRIKTPLDYFERTITDEQISLAEINASYLQEFLTV